MANTYLTLGHITYECARVLVNNLVLAKYVNMEYSDEFAKTGAKIGDTANLRLPVRYVVKDGAQLQLQDAEETSTPVRLDRHKHIGLAFSQVDRLLSIDDFSKRFIQPAVASLANKIDADVAQLYKKVWNSVGTPGTVPNSSSTYLDAGVLLDNNAAPQDESRFCVTTSKMQARLIAAEQTLFNHREEISRQYKKGRIGVAHGFNWYFDQNMATHTVGTYGGAPLTNGAGQTGNSLITDGWSSGATSLKEGDVFTIANVYAVNPMSYQSTGDLQQFRVTADISDTAGSITIPIEPAIILSGPKQTVWTPTGQVADGEVITIVGASGTSTPQGLAFHRDAFALVMADLPAPEGGAEFSRVQDKDLGISMILTKQFDIQNYRNICRLDVLYGVAPYRPQLAVRIQS